MMRKNWLVFIVILLAASIACTMSAAQPAPTQPPAVTTSAVGPQATIAPSALDSYETTVQKAPNNARLGLMQLDYPSSVKPGASKAVDLTIYIPAELASTNPEQFTSEIIPADNSHLLGPYASHNASILVSSSMRAELVAPAFQIQEIYPTRQDVDLSSINSPTRWEWVVTAPQTPSEHVLVVRIYLGQEKTPSWVGSFDVVVAESSVTPVPEPTPTPPSIGEQIVQQLVENAPAVFGTIMTTLVALLGLYLQHRSKEKGKK